MVGGKLRRYASSVGFSEHGGRVYGDWDGYPVTVSEGGLTDAFSGSPGGAFNIWVCVRFPRQEQYHTLKARIRDGGRGFRVLDQSRLPHGIRVNLGCTFAKLDAFLAWLMPAVAECGGLPPARCPFCGQPLDGQGAGPYARMEDMAVPAHTSCIDHAAAEPAGQGERHIGRGVLGGLAGGVLGSLPWVTSFLFGFFLWIFGVAIGVGVGAGYRLAGGKPCRVKYAAVLLLTLGFSALCILSCAAVRVAAVQGADGPGGDLWRRLAALLGSEEFQNGQLQGGILGTICALAGCAPLLDELRRNRAGQGGMLRLP